MIKLFALLQLIQLNMNLKKKWQKRLAETWQTKENLFVWKRELNKPIYYCWHSLLFYFVIHFIFVPASVCSRPYNKDKKRRPHWHWDLLSYLG
jgi:hypothetical protein